MKSSLYIHIPFCKRKCSYCDFYSMDYGPDIAGDYTDIIIKQIGSLADSFSTVYVGGGTPSALPTALLERLLKALRPKVDGAQSIEYTFEANPDSLSAEKVELLLSYGVNRLSIGVQSLYDSKLNKLGRLHSAVKASNSVSLAAKEGFSNISIDMIFGVWGETDEEWRGELREVVKLPIKHISCYSLTYEKGTPLFRALQNKSIAPLEDEFASEMYESTIDILADSGFRRYEISSFARRKQFESKHNSSYWENKPYIGIGASAVSYCCGERSVNVADVREYIKRYRCGATVVESSEKLSPERRARETAAVKIRTTDGINFKWFKETTGYDYIALEGKALPGLISNGFIRFKRSGNTVTGVALTRQGFLFCDTVSSEML